ncbi:amino acid ABC transporter permease [Solicola gregarius]|uniref:Amino acid ABC transporter permease n=1 Tax=Solicola gregarius TaxID=2908642 RepID=A0AA46YK07_9ACTN|nr:amino acid ABC transporter permease [Solicola gregarius]UYM04124.1 amino acid ABC transporter permease [Solicola gregarius]
MDAITKPRVRRRSWVEYVMWAACVILFLSLAYTLANNPNYKWDVVAEYFTEKSVIDGLLLTITLTFITMFLGTLLGLFIAILRASSVMPVRLLANAYITFFRGTPVLVQLIFWFNVAALYPDIRIGIPFTDFGREVDVNAVMSATTAACVGLTLNQAAYMAEIIRGGFNAVPKGQLEAADSLGMSEWTRMRKVIIPQAMPTIIPATGNQLIGMFKETSLVSVLGVADLLQSVQLIYARNYETIPLLIVACLWYLIITLALSYPQSVIERHYSKSTRKATPGQLDAAMASVGEAR